MGCRGCLIVVGVLVIIIAGIIGGAYYLITRPSALVAGMPTVTPSKEAAVEFDRKLERFFRDLGSTFVPDGSGTVTLEITEAEATSKLAELVRSGQLPVEVANPQVHFRNDRIQVSGNVEANGVAVKVAVQALVETREGQPQIVIEKVDVGSFGVPDWVRRQVLDSLTSGTGALRLPALPIAIEAVNVADGKLVVQGQK